MELSWCFYQVLDGPERVYKIFQNDFGKAKVKSDERGKMDSHKANMIFSSKSYLKLNPFSRDIWSFSFFSIYCFPSFSLSFFKLRFSIEENKGFLTIVEEKNQSLQMGTTPVDEIFWRT